jgi:hypothetical protein
MKIEVTIPKPRNPVVLAARRRRAGVHETTEKVRRREGKQALRKAIRQGREDFSPFSFFTVLARTR